MTSLSPQTVVAGVGVANGLWHRFRDSPRRLVECLNDLEARLKRGGSKAIVAVALTHLEHSRPMIMEPAAGQERDEDRVDACALVAAEEEPVFAPEDLAAQVLLR